MQEPIRCELISWTAVQHLTRSLAAKIRASGFRPDVVVAIARGAYVPARVLCDHLDIMELTSIRIVHYHAGAHKQRHARLTEGLCRGLDGRRVLLVDDVSDTGDTLVLARDHLLEGDPREVRIAVLHHKQVASVAPDYYARRVIKWRWIVYPWALMEDLRGFIARMPQRPADLPALAARLQSDHGIRVSEAALRDALGDPLPTRRE